MSHTHFQKGSSRAMFSFLQNLHVFVMIISASYSVHRTWVENTSIHMGTQTFYNPVSDRLHILSLSIINSWHTLSDCIPYSVSSQLHRLLVYQVILDSVPGLYLSRRHRYDCLHLLCSSPITIHPSTYSLRQYLTEYNKLAV